MQQGQEVGALARQLYPKGIFVSATDGKTTAEITQDLIVDETVETLFEATFLAGPFVAKADILRRGGGAWHVLEVKSSFSDTSKIKELIDDLAYTVMAVRRAGLHLNATRRFAHWCDEKGLRQLTDEPAFHVGAFVKACLAGSECIRLSRGCLQCR
jgi:hypothetical protein